MNVVPLLWNVKKRNLWEGVKSTHVLTICFILIFLAVPFCLRPERSAFLKGAQKECLICICIVFVGAAFRPMCNVGSVFMLVRVNGLFFIYCFQRWKSEIFNRNMRICKTEEVKLWLQLCLNCQWIRHLSI